MIGKIMTGKSFGGCLNYCLHDKIADEKKNELVMKDRAEIILFNQCFGNDKELIQQFNDVRQLNPRLSKPVLHVTLSLSHGEYLPACKLAEMALDCAKDLGFSNNQYVAILHKDTAHPHIHIVANRIGFDGKTVSDSHNFQKIAKLCRKQELKHELKQVLSPNAFLPKELRNYQRMDGRKQQVQADIKHCIASSKNYDEFEQKMKALKYDVIKMRGIAFRDRQKVYTKGSEVGYSLATIEKLLAQKQELKIGPQKEKIQNAFADTSKPESSSDVRIEKQIKNAVQSATKFLLKPDQAGGGGDDDSSSMTDEQKRRRKHKHRH